MGKEKLKRQERGGARRMDGTDSFSERREMEWNWVWKWIGTNMC